MNYKIKLLLQASKEQLYDYTIELIKVKNQLLIKSLQGWDIICKSENVK